MYHILVVEDEPEISSIVMKYIEKEGHTCQLANNGFEALELFNHKQFHLVVLDIMMPGIDGYEVLSQIRKISEVPVIFLTAKDEEFDRIKGFDYGADDYVIKPFSPRELMKKIHVFLKRVYQGMDEIVLTEGPFQLMLQSMKLYAFNDEIPLTTAEFKVLSVFMRHKGQVLTRDQIIDDAFGEYYDGVDRSIDSYIKRIRQKIESNPKEPKYLKTKYGQGYVFGGDLE